MTRDREPDVWDACPPGTLKQMTGRIRLDGRREFLRTVAKGSAAAVLLGAGGVVTAQWMLKDKKPLACGEVVELLPDYAVHRLDEDLTRRVAAHLAKCPACQAHYEEMVG